MVDGGTKVTRFEDLRVWQDALELAVVVHKTTKAFPDDERYGITSQIRRAASSISANIAEGFGRRSLKDKTHFYTMAYGSILEVKNFLHLSFRLEYIEEDPVQSLLDTALSIQKQLNALIRTIHV